MFLQIKAWWTNEQGLLCTWKYVKPSKLKAKSEMHSFIFVVSHTVGLVNEVRVCHIIRQHNLHHQLSSFTCSSEDRFYVRIGCVGFTVMMCTGHQMGPAGVTFVLCVKYKIGKNFYLENSCCLIADYSLICYATQTLLLWNMWLYEVNHMRQCLLILSSSAAFTPLHQKWSQF